MCMQICICIYIYISIFVYLYVYIFVSVCVCVYICMHIRYALGFAVQSPRRGICNKHRSGAAIAQVKCCHEADFGLMQVVLGL